MARKAGSSTLFGVNGNTSAPNIVPRLASFNVNNFLENLPHYGGSTPTKRRTFDEVNIPRRLNPHHRSPVTSYVEKARVLVMEPVNAIVEGRKNDRLD
jgi:hypothetical protein